MESIEQGYIQLFKSGDSMAIVTTCQDEDEFVLKFCNLLSEMIESGLHDNDWSFQLQYWLRDFVDICVKFRGYKNDVQEYKILKSGCINPSAINQIASIDSRDNIKIPFQKTTE